MSANLQGLPSAPPGVFATRTPSTVVFTIALLLFVLPFAELKCKPPRENREVSSVLSAGNFAFTNTGIGLAMGKEWHMGGNSQFQNEFTDAAKETIKTPKPNYYAIVALVMAALGVGFSFVNRKGASVVTTVTGGLGAGALVGLMIDLNKKSNDLISQLQQAGNKVTGEFHAQLVLSFTPWFYIAIIALITAAAFSYKRILSQSP